MSTIQMPVPDVGVLRRRDVIISSLLDVLGSEVVISSPSETLAYDCDALSLFSLGGCFASHERGSFCGIKGLP